MKNTIFTVFFLVATSSLQSQIYVDDMELSRIEGLEIVQILVQGKLFSPEKNVLVDYGQAIRGWNKSFITDSLGKKMNFTGSISVINYMERNGWAFFEALLVTVGGKSVYHYYFRRKRN